MVVRKLLPYGVKDYYPEEVEKLNKLVEEIKKELSLWGYREIKLPSLEYKELFESALGKKLKDGFSFKDCTDGDTLALRYDFTPQILRFVFHSKNKRYPLRVFYGGNVYRSEGQLWEEPVLGFELVGASSIEADAEVVAILESIFEKLKLKNFKLLIGHRKAYDHLAERFGKEALIKKFFKKELLPYLKVYPLNSKGWENLELPKGVKEELKTLRELFNVYGIKAENAFFAPSLEPERDYYSGVFFKFISERETLAGGGRYDKLFESFGEKIPATGGGIKLLPLLETLPKGETERGVYIIDTTPNKVYGWKIAKLLRERGIPAERDIVKRSVEESVKVAKEKGYKKVVVIGDENFEGFITLKVKEIEDNLQSILEKLINS